MRALDELQEVYRDPHGHARAWKADTGRAVVGCLGLDVPHELVEAAGMLPVRVLPHPHASLEAISGLCEGASGPVLSSLAARLLDGTYGYLDHLIISSRPTFHIEIHALLRELQRAGPAPFSASIRLFDFHHDEKASTQRFNLDSVQALASDLESWSDTPLTDRVLRSAIQASNHNRSLLAKLDALRAQGRLPGSDLLVLSETGNLMQRHRHSQLLQELLAAATGLPTLDGVPVVYSGSDTDDLSVYKAIEAAGAHIVADDQDRGTRQLAPLIDEDSAPLEAIARRYRARAPSSWGFRTGERVAYLAALAAERRPAGVLFHVLAADHPTAWDYPALRDALDRSGIPSLHLTERAYGSRNLEQLTLSVREFIRQQQVRRPSSHEAQSHE